MDRKQSQFTTVDSLGESDFLPAFGQSTNKKITKLDLFKQIKNETQVFIYPTIEQLQSASLIADPDWPIYVRVEETEYRLYKITSLSPVAGDISLNNGVTATLQDEYSEIGFVVGPDSSTNNAVALFDGETGTQLKNGPIISNVGASLLQAPDVADTSYIKVNSDESITFRNTTQHKTDLLLNNVDNTSDLNKPISTPAQAALDLKAPLSSPVFTGNPSAPTPPADDNDTSIATTAYVQTELLDRPQTIDNVAALSTFTPVAGQVYYLKEYNAGTGVGGGELVGKVGVITPNNVTTFASGTAGVYFERDIKGSTYYTDWAGARGASKGGDDDTSAINATILACSNGGGGNVICRADTYMIDGNANPNVFIYGGIKMMANVSLDLNGATLKLKTTSNANYAIINGWQTADFEVKNGTLIGDIVDHTGTTGEFGHGLFLAESKRVIIDNIIQKDCWGDGIYLSEESVEPAIPGVSRIAEDIYVYNSSFTRNRRQGCSITGAKNIHFYSCKFMDTGILRGIAPSAGVDIEPLIAGLSCTNISFNDCLFSGNATGVALDTAHPNNIRDITFNNCTIENSTQSGYFADRSPANIKNIVFNSCKIDQGVYGAVNTTFNKCFISRNSGSSSIYAVGLTDKSEGVRFSGGEVRSVGTAFRLMYLPGLMPFRARPIFNNVTFILDSGPAGVAIVAFSPVSFDTCHFLTVGTTPSGYFGIDYENDRLGKNFVFLKNCYFDPQWNGGLAHTTGPISMSETSVYSLVQEGSITPNCGMGDVLTINFSSGSAMGILAPVNAYGRALTIIFKNQSGGNLGSIVWDAVFKLSAWTSPANGFQRAITFVYNGTNWVEITRTAADVPN